MMKAEAAAAAWPATKLFSKGPPISLLFIYRRGLQVGRSFEIGEGVAVESCDGAAEKTTAATGYNEGTTSNRREGDLLGTEGKETAF